jgi:hypothetical protein
LEEAIEGTIEDAWEGWGMWGDAVSLFLGWQTQQQKTTNTLQVVALDSHERLYFRHNNQPKTLRCGGGGKEYDA